ncbi:class I SAM-dependent methyltransferase [Yeosuana sp. MJ-SS3]|uniref:Class I SAM-dependent methyltransferase n=1 Tax=Gilvirhabdus luticola TaxID=3079858 RepID=A0ABU3U4Y4_9FLAO|nr:class I SAM-dependent methyltransferase [Yeosuana sp. MJ-SS3]MDU8885468.1 class I SAM-dependent methyltransferase [Yeosuana sp. MJ-SS3]
MTASKSNTVINKEHFDHLYLNVNINSILKKINNLHSFLNDATKTDTSWVGMYYDDFQNKLKGKKVLELGCGDCTNAAIMAALGADVYANDISQVAGKFIENLNEQFPFDTPITFIKGDFLESELTPNFYDIVIGKAFVHHLTPNQEIQFIEKIVTVLKPNGLVRYFEPAINSKFLDKLRWLIPVSGRPSKLQRKEFESWKMNDPHPERDNSSKNYERIGKVYFEQIRIIPFGSIERFHRLLPQKYDRKFRRFAFKLEKQLPNRLNLTFARSHLIEYRNPIKSGELNV